MENFQSSVAGRSAKVTTTTAVHAMQELTQPESLQVDRHDPELQALPSNAPRHLPVYLTHKPPSVERSPDATKRSRSLSPSSQAVDDYNLHRHRDVSPSSSIPQRTLRHKKRMTTLRSAQSTPHGSKTNITCRSLHDLSPQPDNHPSVPLGHPSRPYYSAIRKNMSRPGSPFDHSATSSLFHLPITPPLPRPIPSALSSDNLAPASAIASALTSSRLWSAPLSGCSLSGEMEMRMALASQRVRGTPLEYKFRDDKKHEKGGVMKKLSKGFRHLVAGLSVKVMA